MQKSKEFTFKKLTMKKMEISQMENLQGGFEEPSCSKAAGWIVGFGSVLCLSGALLPLGIVITGAGVLSAFAC